MTAITLGTCSICGGPVTTPRIFGIVGPPPPPKCAHCGAVPANAHGSVIQMQPATKKSNTRDFTEWLRKTRG